MLGDHALTDRDQAIVLGGRRVGHGEPVFVIAEAGVNHNGDVELATRLVDVAVEAGADAVKFQTFKADRLASPAAPKAGYQLQSTSPGETQLDMLRRLELSVEAHRRLKAHAEGRGLLFLSTPFDPESADLLDGLGVPAFKIGSGEVTNLPFLEYVAGKGKPVILSTGMSSLAEVGDAVGAIRGAGNHRLVLLHCVSSYPADPGEANLRAMRALADAFRVPVGYSDHTPGVEVALAAVALGAVVVEKHFTLDRSLPGPDHRASAEPRELQALIRGIRTVERALGDGVKAPAPSEMDNRVIVRRSLAAAVDLPPGTVLTRDMVRAVRPGTGIAPAFLGAVIGHHVRRALKSGELLTWGDLG
ncbi:MAG: N-acetylneuraminate synthase [Candidatus Rokubacteria bacterium]|nr:N-acetylneuraminate synthase [Candidatus Rokubacteria bacterium]